MDVYLDQNHWIGLARAYHGRSTDAPVIEVARLARDAVNSGTARFPISRIHLLEATKIGDDARRSRLIKAFLFFSRGWVVRPIEAVAAEELSKWARGEQTKAASVVRRGLLSAYADYEIYSRQLEIPVAEVEAEDKFGDEPGAWMFALSQPWFRKSATVTETSGHHYAATVESVRAEWLQLPADERLAHYALGVLDDVLDTLKPHTSDVEAAAARLHSLALQELIISISQIPTLDVMAHLGEAKARDRTRPTAPNDLWDLAFLALAIPYFDVVVTERFWAHLATSLRLDVKYSCRVLGKLEELASTLEVTAATRAHE